MNNLFATVLTYPAPSANYRGESEMNRTVIQKITDGRFDYPIISPEAMRNALREILASKYKLKCNRERLNDEDQLAVRFKDYPDPDKYADDFLFGYLVAASGEDRKKIRKEIAEKRGKDAAAAFTFKRDSVLRMNLAKALEPYRFNTVFTQSPQDLTPKDVKGHTNDNSSNLLHREMACTAFQYPFALNGEDCKPKPDWVKALLCAIGELAEVAGNHARSDYPFGPASILIRLTNRLVPGYHTYGFTPEGKFPEVLGGILHDPTPDYPGEEFYIGGKIVKQMSKEDVEKLTARKVTLDRDPQRLLATVADKFLGGQ
jgi:CRISPR-associated protein Cst2